MTVHMWKTTITKFDLVTITQLKECEMFEHLKKTSRIRVAIMLIILVAALSTHDSPVLFKIFVLIFFVVMTFNIVSLLRMRKSLRK